MEQAYLNLVRHVLDHGKVKENRTGVDTLYAFSQHYTVDISTQFPLLTTKNMGGGVWNSLIHELLWYLSGEHHIRNFEKHSKIWSAWADDNRDLQTAYGRFWRRYPMPEHKDHLPGEAWPSYADMCKFVNEETHEATGEVFYTFDQIAFILDTLVNNPTSRRMVLTAWNPPNAAVSLLPPCHFAAVFSVDTENRLNCHLTQRSGDIGLGVPFNLACYSALTYILAKATHREAGMFSHTIVDAHIYCGEGDDDPFSHVPALREQVSREPREAPTLEILREPREGESPLDYINSLTFDDFVLKGYDNPHPRLKMKVAE